MKPLTIVFALVLAVAGANAQSIKQVENKLFKVNALLPGVSYELGIGGKSTVNLDAIIGFSLNGGTGRSTEFGIFPALQAEYRYFVNFDRRLGKNKNISGNSGNYVGLVNQFQLGSPILGNLDYNSDYFYNLAVVYGIQRTRPKGFYWGVSFGPAIFIDEFSTDPGIFTNLRLGWVIGRNKNK